MNQPGYVHSAILTSPKQATHESIINGFTSFCLVIIITMPLLSCSGHRPTNIGINDGKLTSCPSSPNCVSSDAKDEDHKILPFHFKIPAPDAWLIARNMVLQLPNTEIISETSTYLHAECSSTVFGFIDDLELHLRAADGIIAARSASRLGYSDFGVNRKRIENLRSLLIDQGINKR